MITGLGFSVNDQDVQRAIWREQKATQRSVRPASTVNEHSIYRYLEANQMVQQRRNAKDTQ
jgi:hypothetical protein